MSMLVWPPPLGNVNASGEQQIPDGSIAGRSAVARQGIDLPEIRTAVIQCQAFDGYLAGALIRYVAGRDDRGTVERDAATASRAADG